MTLVYIYVALALYNTEIMTLPMNSVETIVDDAAQIAVIDSRGRFKAEARRAGAAGRRKGKDDGGPTGLVSPTGELNWKEVWSHGTDAVMDIPLAGVCEVLYGEDREFDEEDD